MPAEPEEIESLGLTFTAGLPGIGEPVSMALCEDGDEVAVTINNLREYVQAYADCILRTSVEKQVGLLTPNTLQGSANLSISQSLEGVLVEFRFLIFRALPTMPSKVHCHGLSGCR